MKKDKMDKQKRHIYYLKNREYIIKKSLEWNKKNHESKLKNDRKYISSKKFKDKRKTKKFKRVRKRYNKNYRKINKYKTNAQQQARRSIPLKDKCEICGSKKNLQNHHWRYDIPLLVNTLCSSCHKIQHIKRKWHTE